MTPGRFQAGPTTRVITRSVVYYVILIGAATLAWPHLPHSGGIPVHPSDPFFGPSPSAARQAPVALEGVPLAGAVAMAMLASVLLALPVAWMYLATRAKRGYQQSVVQLLVILPAVVAGTVLLVKYSLALAFSLAGIVAAVRFRNTLEDSKDAVYVFLATAIGLAAAVDLPVAAVISIGFNVIVMVLWYTDFGREPVELDGRLANRRLRRARQLARTGTFVAQIDDEVFSEMTREQLEGVAERAWRRARSVEAGRVEQKEVRVRVRTRDIEAMRTAIEPKLEEHTKQWRTGALSTDDGIDVLEYVVQLKKKSSPDDLLVLVRAAGSTTLLDAELI